jgi:hypothetical protein
MNKLIQKYNYCVKKGQVILKKKKKKIQSEQL